MVKVNYIKSKEKPTQPSEDLKKAIAGSIAKTEKNFDNLEPVFEKIRKNLKDKGIH